MGSFVALPFFRCCEESDQQHRLIASSTIQCLIFSLIFDCAMTQVLRRRGPVGTPTTQPLHLVGRRVPAGGHGLEPRLDGQALARVGDGYSEHICTLVFVGEWLLVLFLLLYFLPFSWLVPSRGADGEENVGGHQAVDEGRREQGVSSTMLGMRKAGQRRTYEAGGGRRCRLERGVRASAVK